MEDTQNGHLTSWQIDAEQVAEGWVKESLVKQNQTVTFDIPVAISEIRLEDQTCFFKVDGAWIKRGRKFVGWTPIYDRGESILTRFLNRFSEEGHLCFGEKRYYKA